MRDPIRQLEDALISLRREFNEYRNTNPLENSSVRDGILRFTGGTLRVDSGGRLELEGTLEGGGTILWTGTITNNGKFTNNGELLQLGPWELEGDGTITGDVGSTGEWTQIGPWHLNGDGSISGDVDITGTLRLLSELIVSSLGKITVGGMVIDPANGGSVTFPGGAVVKAGTSGGVEVRQGNYAAVVTSVGASIGKTGLAVAVTDAVGIQFVGLPTTTGKGLPAGTLWADGTGRPFRALS